MICRAVRGAITVEQNKREDILLATKRLLENLVDKNDIRKEDIVSIYFTVTEDLNAVFPAVAARELGWSLVPMLCSYEIAVPGSLPKCLRVLLTFNTEKKQEEILPQYLAGAFVLRPDLATETN